jgi:glutaredoxin
VKNNKEAGTKKIIIEFMYLDLEVCGRCKGTADILREAISDVTQVLEAAEIQVEYRDIHIKSEEQAKKLEFLTSPTIRINGEDIQMDFEENFCEDCGELCGDEVDCRIWKYNGQEYTIPPKSMIINAILKEIYGDKKLESKNKVSKKASSNLSKFFAAKNKTDKNKICDCNDSCC